LAAGADCLCFGTLIQRRQTSRTTLYRLLEELSGRFVLLDINLRPDCYARRNILESIGRANILKLKDGEAERLVQIYKLPRDLVATEPGVFAETLFACTDLQYIVLTLGERGAFAAPRAPW
jgi:fructokinase